METATRLTELAAPLPIPLLLNTEATSTSTKTSPGQLTHLGEQICFKYFFPTFVQLFWPSCLSDACASDRPLPGSLTFQRLRLRHVPLCEDFQRKQSAQLPSGGYKGHPDPVRGEDRRSGSLYSTGGSRWETKSKFSFLLRPSSAGTRRERNLCSDPSVDTIFRTADGNTYVFQGEKVTNICDS